MGKNCNKYIAWFTVPIFQMLKETSKYKSIMKEKNIVALQSFLSFNGFVLSLGTYLFYVAKMFKYLFILLPRIKENYEGFDISAIVKGEFERFALSGETLTCILIMNSIREFVKKSRINTIIYRSEIQPHERAILFGCAGICKTVGFQHQAIASNHIQYSVTKEEMNAIYGKEIHQDNQPMPDFYCVSGEYAFDLMRFSGFPEAFPRVSGEHGLLLCLLQQN
jgi:hypothetical protein